MSAVLYDHATGPYRKDWTRRLNRATAVVSWPGLCAGSLTLVRESGRQSHFYCTRHDGHPGAHAAGTREQLGAVWT